MFCWIVRWVISNHLDTSENLPGYISRHMDRCHSCASFYQGAVAIEKQLGQPEEISFHVSPETVINSVMLYADRTHETKKAAGGSKLRRAIAVAAILLIISLILWERHYNNHQRNQLIAQSIDLLWPGELANTTTNLKNPIVIEFDNLVDDAQRGGNFVACQLNLFKTNGQ
jgi:hypothetical protein